MYNHDVLKQCPGCASQAASDDTNRKSTDSSRDIADERNSELARLLEKSIQASNRTTFAVRAMVSYTVITVLTILLTTVFVGLGFLAVGSWLALFLVIIGLLVLLVGTIYALVTLIHEWALSNVPRN
jgi:ABC-type multidrug transport system fused ATPase/permease subunit